MVIEDLVKTVLSELKEITKTETVVGKPIKTEDTTIIPVSRVSIGFGAGGGKKDLKNGGGEGTGGGASVDPVAFIVIRKDKVELISLKKGDVGLGKVIDLIPQVVEKVKNFKERKNKYSKKTKKDVE